MGKQSPLTKLSKFLSLILRHKPEEIGLKLDAGGWAKIDELLAKMPGLTKELLFQIVEEDEKKRYSFSDSHTMIRAAQGHSIKVDLGLSPEEPPFFLYHGTAKRSLPSILKQGLLKMRRQFVHLSDQLDTAKKVGARHGDPVVLAVASNDMRRDGFVFYLAENGVWLTDQVPTKYLTELPPAPDCLSFCMESHNLL